MVRARSQSSLPAGVRADPKTETAGPKSASAPKPSTNSDWIRRTRHGSSCNQSAEDWLRKSPASEVS